MKRNIRAVVFPHSFVPDEDIRKALSVFQELTLFQPWFMNKPLSMAAEQPDLLRVLTPSDRLRPPGKFEALLADYRQWIRTNDEKAFAAFLAYTGARAGEESPSWEIRSEIRQMGQRVEGAEESASLKWHLILHLAEETEGEQREAEKMFEFVKALDSPLKGALEEEDLPGLMSDLQSLDREVIFSKERLRQILDAWTGLFSDKIPRAQPLITFSPPVLKYLSDTWEELAPAAAGEGMGVSSLELTFPDLSDLNRGAFPDKGKSFLEDSTLLKAIDEFCRDPGQKVSRLKERDGNSLMSPRQGSLRLALKYLFPLGEGRILRRYEFMKHFSGKMIGLIEEAGTDEK